MATYSIILMNTVTGYKVVSEKGLTLEQARKNKKKLVKFQKQYNLNDVSVKIKIEMNQHETFANALINRAISEWVGGNENTLLDFDEDSKEYKEAKAMLTFENLFDAILSDVMGETEEMWAREVRFAGKQFIEERIEQRLNACGYHR